MLYITSQGPRGLEYISSKTQESAEATISEYRHQLDKFALRRLAQKYVRSKRQGLQPGSLLTTPSRRRSPRSSRHRRWHLAPGLRHLVASTGKKKKGGKGGAKQP